MYRALVEKANKHQIVTLGYRWKGFEVYMTKCPHIVRLDLKCMGHDQKKSQEPNSQFDS
jgi:hypothetical protein